MLVMACNSLSANQRRPTTMSYMVDPSMLGRPREYNRSLLSTMVSSTILLVKLGNHQRHVQEESGTLIDRSYEVASSDYVITNSHKRK